MKSKYRRTWLNSVNSSSTGSVKTNLEPYLYRKGSIDGNLIVSDCNRSVSLDFSFNNERERKQAIKKAQRFIDILESFKNDIEEIEIPTKKVKQRTDLGQ